LKSSRKEKLEKECAKVVKVEKDSFLDVEYKVLSINKKESNKYN